LSHVAGTEIQQPTYGAVIAAQGSLTILAGNNSVTYVHGLGRTPLAIVGPTNDTGTTWYYTIDGTNLKIFLSGGGLALGNLTFSYVLI
jgi:hypothetical protein